MKPMLGKGWRGRGKWTKLKNPSSWTILGVTVSFVAMALIGFYLIQTQVSHLRLHTGKDLASIGALKVDQITDWCKERLRDASDLSSDPSFRKEVFATLRTNTASPEWTAKINHFLRAHAYEDIVLVDQDGHLVWSASGKTLTIADEEVRSLHTAFKKGASVLTDFYRHSKSEVIHCSVVIPFHDPHTRRTPGIILIASADDFLYPLIQTWPEPSDSAETLLVERQGDHVLFLNELRHKKGTALTLGIPLSQTQVPAVQVVLGRKGLFEGSDYRGVPSISVLSQVPGTSWFMVSKVDTEEAFRTPRIQARLLTGLLVAVLAMFLCLGFVFRLRRKRAQIVQETESIMMAQRDLGLRLGESTNLEQGLFFCLETALSLSGMDSGSIYLVQPTTGALDLVLQQGLPAEAILAKIHFEPNSDEFNFLMGAQSKPITHASRGIPLDEARLQDGTRAFAVIPIKHGDRILGCLNLASHDKDGIPPNSQAPVEVLASQIGSFITRLQAEETLRQHSVDLEVQVESRTAELSSLNRRLQLVLDSSSDGIYGIDLEGNCSFVNRAALTILGYAAPEEVVGRNCHQLFHHSHPDHSSYAIQDCPTYRVILGQAMSPVETEVFWRKDGSPVQVRYDNRPTLEEGRIIGAVVTFNDITERKRIEQALQESEARYRSIVEDQSELICRYDPDGKLTFVNEAYARYYGKSHMELMGRTFIPEIPDSDLALINKGLDGITPDNPSAVFEHRIVAPDGGVRWQRWTHRGIYTPMGRLIEHQAVGSDITERKRQEEYLAHAKETAETSARAKSAFLANMSHETRTPLNAVLGFTQLLLKEQGLTIRQQDYLRTINRAGDHLLSLINEILELARIDFDDIHLLEAPFDLHLFLEDLALIFRIRAEVKGLTLDWSLDPGVPRWVIADSNKLRQILINLLGNAVKFTSTGRVSLEVRWAGSCLKATGGAQHLILEVKDTGPGIAREDLERIFSAFEQTEEGASKGGAGIGLAISRQFARMMGGDIEAHSKVGQGSCFRLSFGLKVGEPLGVPLPKPITRIKGGYPECHILIVDDREENRVLLREMMSPLGVTIREASNWQDAFKAFGTWSTDSALMILDLQGSEILDSLREVKATEQGHRIKILVVSSNSPDFNQQDALNAGADGVISKPFREAQLLEALGQILGLDYEEMASNPALLPAGPEPAALSPELISLLRGAAILASYDELLEILTSMESEHPRTAAKLQSFIEHFDYPGLIAFLDAHEGSHG